MAGSEDRTQRELERRVVEDDAGNARGTELHGAANNDGEDTNIGHGRTAGIDASTTAQAVDGSHGSNEDESTSRGKKRKSDEISRDGQNRTGIWPESNRASATSSTASVYKTPPERSMSPSGRNRGMSLRSRMFSRNIQRRDTDDAIIELQNVPSSSNGAGDAANPKELSSSTVAVSKSQDGSDRSKPSPASSSRENTKGTAMLRNYQSRTSQKARRWIPTQQFSTAYTTVRKFVLRIKDIPPSKNGRHIPIDLSRQSPLTDDRTGHGFMNNFIKSSKYTVWNFLPRQLFAQFSKLANFYFLTISILQLIPGLSTVGRFTTLVPLMFFVSLSMGKEGYEDFRRHRLDKAENNKIVNVLRSSQAAKDAEEKEDLEAGDASVDPDAWAPVKWQALQVGDVVKIERDEPFPADLLLLDSKGEHNIAYIETMALDGETNLKNKQPPAALIGKCTSVKAISAVRAEAVVEDPNVDLYNFEGKVSLNSDPAATPLTNNEVVYRGSVLRNTPSVVGMVIYSGEECKIRMNANKNPRIKAPLLQSIVNKIVIMMVVFVLALSFSQAIAYQFWDDFEQRAWYLTNAHVPFGQLVVSFILMFNTLIPLSLYVALEIVKVGQVLLLNDIDMYDEESNTPFEAHTSTINEELGQVSYVFSDKTGTLTENVMRFRKLSVAGTAWLHDVDLKKQSDEDNVLKQLERNEHKGKRPLRPTSTRQSTSRFSGRLSREGTHSGVQTPRKSTTSWRSVVGPNVGQPELNTTEMIRYIQRRPHTAFARKASMMILAMALCHTCLPEHGNTEDELRYQAASPDELALVEAAKDLGYIAFHREMSILTLKTYPNGLQGEAIRSNYEILDVIEFSSQRKRMSVVVRFPDSRICVICKGADSIIMDRLRLGDMARRIVADIERRIEERRNAGAAQALERKSSVATDRKGSITSHPRTSMALPRASRSSIGRLAPVRDNVDGWLEERESEPTTPVDHSRYSPRPSAQLARHSSAFASRRSSYQQDNREEDLVEESLVLNDATVIERCFQHINDFATEGLRTLLYGHRFLDASEYAAWKKIFSDATTSLTDRTKKIEEAGELIERDLELSGATAIEDKLQTGVPETIDRLRRASIKMWMLTGDKRETAINIGHSCRLIKDYSTLTILDHVVGNIEQNIATATIDIHRGSIAHAVIILDGPTLGTIQADESMHALFLDLAILADSVICCRASPSQKAGLVHAIRRRVSGSVTLAIGDGANDIAMIQEAHVGIGITGKEGLQAARVSDYSIAQFRFLAKLLLVHGRWNYVRTCKYIVATFWKELLFYLTQASFQRRTGFTGTSLYEQWSLSMFNTLFTSLAVIFLGIFEQDLSPATLLAVPELYTKGQRSAGFNFKVYFAWMFMAASESMIVYFVVQGLWGRVSTAVGWDRFSLGQLSYSVCVILINLKLQVLEQRYKSYMAVICLVLQIGGWFLWNVIFSEMYHDNYELSVEGGFLGRFGTSVLWWLALVIGTSACVVFELAVRAVKCAVWPTDVEVFQELEKDPTNRRRFEESSEGWLKQGWEMDRGASSEVVRRRMEAGAEGVFAQPMVVESGKAGVAIEEDVTGGAQRNRSDADGKGNLDMHEVFAKGFGKVKK